MVFTAKQTETKTGKQTFVVVDDHESALAGTAMVLQQEYPAAEILTAANSQRAQELIRSVLPQLVLTDLSIPETLDGPAQTEVGLRLLRQLMDTYPTLNLVVQSAHTKSLVRLKPSIDLHKGGFAVVDKSISLADMLKRVDWALQGLLYTPQEMRTGLEVKPEWLEVLVLAFQEGLQDKAIAETMCVSERTVRHYWTKVQDALDVYPEEGQNIRIRTEIRAREAGLID